MLLDTPCKPCKKEKKKEPSKAKMSTKHSGLVKEFAHDIVTGANIALSMNPSLLASVTLNNDKPGNRVWLTGTVQTLVNAVGDETRFVQIQLQLFRNDPTFTTPLFSISDVVVFNGQINLNTTTFNFVDIAPPVGSNTYYLTARITAQDPTTTANVNTVVLTGAEIGPNKS